jgi:hypothetical protein
VLLLKRQRIKANSLRNSLFEGKENYKLSRIEDLGSREKERKEG